MCDASSVSDSAVSDWMSSRSDCLSPACDLKPQMFFFHLEMKLNFSSEGKFIKYNIPKHVTLFFISLFQTFWLFVTCPRSCEETQYGLHGSFSERLKTFFYLGPGTSGSRRTSSSSYSVAFVLKYYRLVISAKVFI